jgi:hypothetical protein
MSALKMLETPNDSKLAMKGQMEVNWGEMQLL